MHLLLIGLLLAGWAVFGIATWRALGALGVIIAAVIVGALIWLLVDFGILDPDTGSEITWIALIAIAVLLARRRNLVAHLAARYRPVQRRGCQRLAVGTVDSAADQLQARYLFPLAGGFCRVYDEAGRELIDRAHNRLVPAFTVL